MTVVETGRFLKDARAHAHFIRQKQSGLPIGFPVLQKNRDERTLPWLKLFAAPIDWTFGQCGGR